MSALPPEPDSRILDLEFRGRRVVIRIGPVIDLPHRGAPARRLHMRTDAGAEARSLCDPGVTVDALEVHARLLLDFESRVRDREAAA